MRWSRVSEGGTSENEPSIESVSLATVKGLERDMGGSEREGESSPVMDGAQSYRSDITGMV